MTADADIVLNTAADLTRAGAWLPAPVHVVDTGTGTVDVTWTTDGDVHRYEIRVSPDEHRLEWRPVGHNGWPGHLRVPDKGAGSSEAELHVETGGQLPMICAQSSTRRFAGWPPRLTRTSTSADRSGLTPRRLITAPHDQRRHRTTQSGPATPAGRTVSGGPRRGGTIGLHKTPATQDVGEEAGAIEPPD